VFVKDVGPVKVVHILSYFGIVYIVYTRIEQVLDLFELPLSSSCLELYKVCGCMSTLSMCAFDDVQTKCLLLPLSAVSGATNRKSSYAAIPGVHTLPDERT